MQIQLKQFEIVQALRQYITKQGIDLVGKDVDISFTAGRKAAGLVADVTIDESITAASPATSPDEAVVTSKPTLSVVAPDPAPAPVPWADKGETPVSGEAPPVEKVATPSLFGT